MSAPKLIKPQFPDDDGSADPRLQAALTAYAGGRAAEHTVLEALSHARLLVPIVAVLNQEETVHGLRREKESDMALPTLIGADGRRGVLGFTSLKTLQLWQADARPVPVRSRDACRTALDEGADALVVDVAGPVPFAVDGVRLHLLAEGAPVPPPHRDPDVLAAIEAAFRPEPGVTGVRVGPGNDTELSVRFHVDPGMDEQAAVRRVGDRLADVLRGRIVGGVELTVARR
ncbi:SseB family protein [Actinocorallia sp. API 0066]|uniref:SseB family protein n=1 Tax=Actinocorallia sp. API 0066 TaxID=2896846 RepID=UPI001E28C426|nr:SseB family protein [Actinocorallia sp. API 0066]MCD0450876.1 SseB family protein [Actinocorallia sp. API 0066]